MGRNETQTESLNHQDLKLVLDISAGYTLDASVWVTGGSDGSKGGNILTAKSESLSVTCMGSDKLKP